MRPAVFLDRDGTINEDRHFVRDPDEIALLDGVPEALKGLRARGYALVVITNQSGIARGYLTEADLSRLHERLQELCGLRFDGLFHCPHHPEGEVPAYRRRCDCRKPRPGLLRQASRLLSLDLSRSVVIGDSARDLLAGVEIDVPGILVRSGKPFEQEARTLAAASADPLAICDDLAEAAQVWLERA